jgi:hypothetical protein
MSEFGFVDYDLHTGLFRLAGAGRFDLCTAADLRNTVLKVFAEHPLAVLINLEGVTSVEPLSLHVLPALARIHDSAPFLVCASRESECGRIIHRDSYPVLASFETEADALSALVGGDLPRRNRLHLHLEPVDWAPTEGRRLVRRACEEWNLPAQRPVAEVIVSELVTNAVRYARTDFEVTVAEGPHHLHMHVCDRNDRLPALPSPAPGMPDGRHGLVLVDRLASSWGVTVMPYGKTVWAALTLSGRRPDFRVAAGLYN